MSLIAEHFYACPYCGEAISSVLDLSVGGQRYVEDCEVCCRAIEIQYEVEADAVTGFVATRLDG